MAWKKVEKNVWKLKEQNAKWGNWCKIKGALLQGGITLSYIPSSS